MRRFVPRIGCRPRGAPAIPPSWNLEAFLNQRSLESRLDAMNFCCNPMHRAIDAISIDNSDCISIVSGISFYRVIVNRFDDASSYRSTIARGLFATSNKCIFQGKTGRDRRRNLQIRRRRADVYQRSTE